MQMLKRPDDGVYWAGGDTQGTADAAVFVNMRDFEWPLLAAGWVEGHDGGASESCERLYASRTSRRAPINGCLARSDCLCVGPAGRVAAALALRLGQYRVDGINEYVGGGSPWPIGMRALLPFSPGWLRLRGRGGRRLKTGHVSV